MRAEWSEVRIMAVERQFSLLHGVHTGSVDHPVLVLNRNPSSFSEVKQQRFDVIIRLRLALYLRISGSSPPTHALIKCPGTGFPLVSCFLRVSLVLTDLKLMF